MLAVGGCGKCELVAVVVDAAKWLLLAVAATENDGSKMTISRLSSGRLSLSAPLAQLSIIWRGYSIYGIRIQFWRYFLRRNDLAQTRSWGVDNALSLT